MVRSGLISNQQQMVRNHQMFSIGRSAKSVATDWRGNRASNSLDRQLRRREQLELLIFTQEAKRNLGFFSRILTEVGVDRKHNAHSTEQADYMASIRLYSIRIEAQFPSASKLTRLAQEMRGMASIARDARIDLVFSTTDQIWPLVRNKSDKALRELAEPPVPPADASAAVPDDHEIEAALADPTRQPSFAAEPHQINQTNSAPSSSEENANTSDLMGSTAMGNGPDEPGNQGESRDIGTKNPPRKDPGAQDADTTGPDFVHSEPADHLFTESAAHPEAISVRQAGELNRDEGSATPEPSEQLCESDIELKSEMGQLVSGYSN